jgi:hypothetical protein
MRYGNWFKEIEAFQENKLPVFFLLASAGILDMFPHSMDVLHHNSLHLTYKKDIRATILDIAETYMRGEYEKSPDLSNTVSLISEKSPKNRTCEMADISIS